MAKEKKVKETPWTEQKMLHKYDQDGVLMPNVYRKFGWETWKRMTADERAMWAEASETTPAPISKEVIDFKEKIAEKSDKVVKLKTKVAEVTHPITISDEKVELTTATLDERPSEIDQVRATLKKRRIKFAYNSKLETLKKKLADADNPE